jgi:hypothetical protein
MFRLDDLLLTNKHGQFWDINSTGLQIKDLSFVASGLFSLNSGNTTMNCLGKFSITTGSKLVYEKLDNVRPPD